MTRNVRTLVGENVKVQVDLANVPANSTTVVTIPVLSASLKRFVTVTPGPLFAASGLVLLGSYPSGGDTVEVIVQNTTGAAIDLASEQWLVLVIH
jgi:hypothetical protein